MKTADVGQFWAKFAEKWVVIPTNTGGQGTLAMLVQAFDSPLLTGSKTPPAEENSLRRENDVRKENGLYLRPYYYND